MDIAYVSMVSYFMTCLTQRDQRSAWLFRVIFLKQRELTSVSMRLLGELMVPILAVCGGVSGMKRMLGGYRIARGGDGWKGFACSAFLLRWLSSGGENRLVRVFGVV